MPLHLVKLCVGVDTAEELQDWIDRRRADAEGRGETFEQRHTTRMQPKRAADLLDGGSLYWVVKGSIQVRQRLLDIRPFKDGEGVSRCHLVLDPALTLTAFRPMRPFQGWRYLAPKDAPPDLEARGDGADLPPHLRRELAELGLL